MKNGPRTPRSSTPGGALPAKTPSRATLLIALSQVALSVFLSPTLGAQASNDHQIAPGYRLELAAQEPLVLDPVDLVFDARGRAFVLEMAGYPIARDSERLGRIVILDDDDGDGRFDRRTVFADDLRQPDSIAPWHDGILVADAPSVVWLVDEDGDDRAESRLEVLRGFAVGPSESNVNGLVFGPDNQLHIANGSSGGLVQLGRDVESSASASPVDIRGRDLRLHFVPESRQASFELTNPTADGYGIAFDDWGERFLNHAQKHIQWVATEAWQVAPAPSPAPREISDHGTGASTRVFPVRATGERPNHPEQAGRMTAASGLTHYGGDALPELAGQFWSGEPVYGVVHRDLVERRGSGLTARRGEHQSEFLAFVDPRARPVHFATGPDGNLWVVDMRREIIEHPEWIPEEMLAGQNVRAGNDEGRIYRVARADGERPRPRPRNLAALPIGELVRELESTNQWRRDTARRLLVERSKTDAVDEIVRLTREAHDPRARLTARWTLDGLGYQLPWETGLLDRHSRVRINAYRRLAERLGSERYSIDREDADRLARRARGSIASDVPAVAVQAMLALEPLRAAAELTELSRASLDTILQAASRYPDDRGIIAAAVAATRHAPLAFFEHLASELDHPHRVPPALFEETAVTLGRSGSASSVEGLLATLRELDTQGEARALINRTLVGLARGQSQRSEKGAPPPSLAHFLASQEPTTQALAWQVAAHTGVPATIDLAAERRAALQVLEREQNGKGDAIPVRLVAIKRLGAIYRLSKDASLPSETLLAGLDPWAPKDLQNATFDVLLGIDRRGTPMAAPLLERWSSLSPVVRERAATLLVWSKHNHDALLSALEEGQVSIGQLQLDLERRRSFLRWSTPEIARRAKRFFDDRVVVTRREALAKARPALAMAGNEERGRQHFSELCARCHRLAGEGSAIGPDLDDASRKSSAALLHDIVDPNAGVSPEYLAYDVTTTNGELVSGLLENQDEAIIVRTADGKERRIERVDIEEVYSSGLSLMPEELESGLDHQQLADLLAWLKQNH